MHRHIRHFGDTLENTFVFIIRLGRREEEHPSEIRRARSEDEKRKAMRKSEKNSERNLFHSCVPRPNEGLTNFQIFG